MNKDRIEQSRRCRNERANMRWRLIAALSQREGLADNIERDRVDCGNQLVSTVRHSSSNRRQNRPHANDSRTGHAQQ